MKIGIEVCGPAPWQVLASKDGVPWTGQIVGWDVWCEHVGEASYLEMTVCYEVPVKTDRPDWRHDGPKETVELLGVVRVTGVKNGHPYFEMETSGNPLVDYIVPLPDSRARFVDEGEDEDS